MLPVLLISDLHLESSRPDITATLLQFLREWQGKCSALYILGDLFEVWIGDDKPSELADQVAQALREFAAAGAAVFLMHGNRDFLMGSEFAERCGGKLISEPFELRFDENSYLLLHGDVLCTDDTDYQAFRRQVRDPQWQQEFLSQSLAAREAFARAAREQSSLATAQKQMAIMDVNPDAVQELVRSSGHSRLIHGHTHRPAQHTIHMDQAETAQRTVLGDWDRQGWYVEITAQGAALKNFPLAA